MFAKKNLFPTLAGSGLTLVGQVFVCLVLLGNDFFILFAGIGAFVAAFACFREVENYDPLINWVNNKNYLAVLLILVGLAQVIFWLSFKSDLPEFQRILEIIVVLYPFSGISVLAFGRQGHV